MCVCLYIYIIYTYSYIKYTVYNKILVVNLRIESILIHVVFIGEKISIKNYFLVLFYRSQSKSSLHNVVRITELLISLQESLLKSP